MVRYWFIRNNMLVIKKNINKINNEDKQGKMVIILLGSKTLLLELKTTTNSAKD